MGFIPRPTTWGGSLGLTLREALKVYKGYPSSRYAGGKVGLTFAVLTSPPKSLKPIVREYWVQPLGWPLAVGVVH